MRQWYLVIDIEKCEDCNNCFLACKDEHAENDWPGYSLSQPRHGHRWMNIMRRERGQYPFIDVAYRPTPCMHCGKAPCIKSAKDGAVYKRQDGIVMIDPEKAKGQKEIVRSCPYDAIWWNEEMEIAQKCTFCAHLLDGGWQKPRCVQSCPTDALRVLCKEGPEMDRIVKSENLEVLNPEYNTRPSVYYKNLYRYNKCFIGGSVAFRHDGITDCAEGARIVLRRGQEKIEEIKTDNFGDFKFDHLEENSGRYTLWIEYAEHEKKTMDVELKTSLNLGTILF
jgi:Fe-S-cluster-containing dehydrogenase component